MKHLKALLTAYRTTIASTTDEISSSVAITENVLQNAIDKRNLQGLAADVERSMRILRAVVADMRAADKKVAKASA